MVDHKQEKKSSNWTNFIYIILVINLDSAFTHGYHMGCVRGMKAAVKEWLDLEGLNTTKHKVSPTNHLLISKFRLIDSSYYLGGAVGCSFTVWFANKFGRKGGMLMSTFISVFASLFGGYSKYFESFTSLLICRVLFGIKHGLNSGLGPMYLFEISPMELRGQISSSYGLIISLGREMGKLCGNWIGDRYYWPLVLSLAVIPAIIQLILLPFCPESPNYLFVMKKNENECRKSLKWLRGSRFKEAEIDTLRNEYHQRNALGEIGFKLIINNPILRYALITSAVLYFSQQVCGISVLLIQLQEQLDWEDYKMLFFIFKFLAAILMCFLIDKFGRKTLYLSSFLLMTISSLSVYILYVSNFIPFRGNIIFIFTSIFIISYKIGCGTLAWFCPSEYFNTSAAPVGYAVGAGANWVLKFCFLTYAVPFSRIVKGYNFLNYTVTNLLLLYFTYYKVPETRNKSIKEVYKSIHSIIKNDTKEKSIQ